MQLRKQLQGVNHPDTATSLNNLAQLYSFQGKYEEAEPLYIQALQLRKQLQGVNHPDTATSLNNLAQLYSFQGKYEEAEPLYIQALQLRKQLQGVNHPDTATSLNNLASLYESQGKYEEAERLYIQALDIVERVLGENHPNTVTIRANLEYLRTQQHQKNEENIITDGGNINIGSGNYNEGIEGDYIQQSGNFGVGINKRTINTDKIAGTINEAKQKTLAEATKEIQELLEQLDKSYDTSSYSGKVKIADETIKNIENNSDLKAQIISALKVGGVKAFEQFLNHPAASFVIGALEDWQKTSNTLKIRKKVL